MRSPAIYALVAAASFIAGDAIAQQTEVPWDGSGWSIAAEESKRERYLGRDCLLIRDGVAWLDSATFADGVIEFDIAVNGDQGFHGLIFRAADRQNYEEFYLRPHQQGRPDATQYQPVYHGNTAWQIYATPRFAQAVPIELDRWVHVRAIIRGRRLEISVDGRTLVFPELQRTPAPGGIGLSSNRSPARFANVSIRAGENPPPEGGEGPPADQIPPMAVRKFRISSPFAESLLEGPAALKPQEWSSLRWTTLETASRGIANIGMLHEIAEGANTVFAAVTLRTERAGAVRARFGFSDRVVVYLNGTPLFRGDDKYRTRDYRFLGTVGFFDELILPLRKGDNDLWFAVSEDFGGWAIALQLPDADRVTIVE